MGGLKRENSDVSVAPFVTPKPKEPAPSRGSALADAPKTATDFAVFVVCSVVATAALLALLFVWDDAPFAFTFDDAYYYFGIARNLAAGQGSTFDSINLTNGYHPLWLLIAATPFKLGLDDLAAARFLLALQLIVGWGTSLVIIGKIVSRSIDGWSGISRREAHEQNRSRKAATATIAIMFTLVALNPALAKVFVNGLETGIVITMMAVLLLIGSRPGLSSVPKPGSSSRSGSSRRRARSWITGTSHRARIAIGFLLAATFLGRTDAAILIGCLFLWCAAEWRHERESFRVGALVALELFALPAATIFGYLLFNQATFGTAFQISGLVKRAPLDVKTMLLFAGFIAAAGFVGGRGFQSSHRRRPSHQPKFAHAGRFAATTGWFGAFCILIVGYYAVLQTQIWLWYFAPPALYAIVLLLLAIVDMSEVALRDGRQNVNPPLLLVPVQILFGVLLGGALVLQSVAFRDPHQLSIQKADRDIGLWLQANTSPGAVVASWDAGAVGYFSHRRVVNLDGLVNSKAYYEAMRHGTVAAFLRCEHVAYVANHGDAINGDDPSFRELIRDVYGPDAANHAAIVFHEPFLYNGTTTGSEGSQSGLRTLMAYVYQVPPATVGDEPPPVAGANPCG